MPEEMAVEMEMPEKMEIEEKMKPAVEILPGISSSCWKKACSFQSAEKCALQLWNFTPSISVMILWIY